MEQTIELFIMEGIVVNMPTTSDFGIIYINNDPNTKAVFKTQYIAPGITIKEKDTVYFFILPTVYLTTDSIGVDNRITALNIRTKRPKLIPKLHTITGQPCNTTVFIEVKEERVIDIFDGKLTLNSIFKHFCINDFGMLSLVLHKDPILPKDKVITYDNVRYVPCDFNKNIYIACGDFKEEDARYDWEY